MAGTGSPPISSPNQLGLNLDNSQTYNNLVAPDWMEKVYGLTGGYNVLSLLIDRIRRAADNGAMSTPRKVDARLGQYTRYVLGQYVVSAQVATQTQSGNNVILTFADPTYAFFRTQDVIQNNTSSNIQGRVISPNFTAGTITIAPIDDSTPLVSTDWATGSGIVALYNAQPYSSTGRAPIYQVPFPTYNYTQTLRESTWINRMDKYKTYPKTSGGMNWAYAQEKLIEMSLATQLENLAWFGVRGLVSSDNTRQSGGLDWAIADQVRGGVYRTVTSPPVAQDLLNYFNDVATNRNEQTVTEVHLVGRGFIGLVQTLLTNNQLQATGVNNTMERINGELIKGFDAMTYAAQGINHVFIHAPALNNSTLYPNISKITGLPGALSTYSCYTIDTGTFMDAENMMTVPSMEHLYFGDNPIQYGVIQGLDKNPFTVGSANNAMISTSSDGTGLEALIDCSYDFMAKYMGVFKLAY